MSHIKFIIIAALATVGAKLVLTPEISNPYLAPLPATPLFCPAPKLVMDNIPGDRSALSILIGQKNWVFAPSKQLTSQPTDLHFAKATILNGRLNCTYLWGNLDKQDAIISLLAPETESYKPVGYHWWKSSDGIQNCQSATIETCAFQLN